MAGSIVLLEGDGGLLGSLISRSVAMKQFWPKFSYGILELQATKLGGSRSLWQWMGWNSLQQFKNYPIVSFLVSLLSSKRLPGLNLGGQLSSAIQSLSELDTLDLSYNTGLTGTVPQEIGNLKKLKSLSLVGCGFSGRIPDSIGSLKQLTFLGTIPRSLGNLSNVDWLDLAENQLEGTIPVSDDQGRPGLDLLLKAHHLLFDHNQLEGGIPRSLSTVSTLEVVRFDKNGLTGGVPANLNKLGKLSEMDLSDNDFNASDIPSWVTTLPGLTTVILGQNRLGGALNLSRYSSSLQLMNLEDNEITELDPENNSPTFELRLANNPLCRESGASERSYCKVPVPNPSFYSTPTNNCLPSPCGSDQVSSPNCKCAFPYSGLLISRALSFSNFSNASYYRELEQSLMDTFRNQSIPVDSVSLSNPFRNTIDNFELTLDVFPSQTDRFNTTGVLTIAFLLSNQIYKPPEFFSPYIFKGANYEYYGGEPKGSKSSSHVGVIVGAVVAVVVFVVLAFFAGMYALRQKRRARRSAELNPFANWEQNTNSGTAPQLKGARWFSFDDLRKYTSNFSETNTIGSGGYGKVYQGNLPSGELVAIKRAAKESMQGAVEFKTEIELLSRVHHKNLVGLVGFCFEKGEQMLGYLDPEYYMTQQLTEKSDVYSFGVLMLELATARRPIEQGKYIVREVMRVMDTSKDLYNLHSILDPTIMKATRPKGLEKFVMLAMRCVKEYAAERPTMAEVVKEIESMIELVGLNPNSESATTSETYVEAGVGNAQHPYREEDFSYSGIFPSTRVEPQ
ncbi:hypothetical protein JHK84_036765 [Glycine max]|nr:hypothetical protein JHK84_036765 [Glycine max]